MGCTNQSGPDAFTLAAAGGKVVQLRITTGQKPINRNLKNEQAQVSTVLTVFKKIFGHEPNFKNNKEDLTWNTMMYRIRFVRDLTKEKQGIAAFQAKFSRIPKSPLDWSTVRALGYIE